MQRVYINMSLSGTIALADFAKIAGLITVEDMSVGLGSKENEPAPASARGSPAAENVSQAGKSNVVDKQPEPDIDIDQTAADVGTIVLDKDGHPWSAALHASTKAQTGAGLWRMKPGASRPAPMPGFPKADGTSTAAGGSPATENASGAAGNAGAAEDDDEFAAFANANKGGEASTGTAARTWTDADLSKLNNQAAVKLGSPDKIKPIIARFVPEGSPQHSRNVPVDKREAYAAAIEEVAGIEFEG